MPRLRWICAVSQDSPALYFPYKTAPDLNREQALFLVSATGELPTGSSPYSL